MPNGDDLETLRRQIRTLRTRYSALKSELECLQELWGKHERQLEVLTVEVQQLRHLAGVQFRTPESPSTE